MGADPKYAPAFYNIIMRTKSYEITWKNCEGMTVMWLFQRCKYRSWWALSNMPLASERSRQSPRYSSCRTSPRLDQAFALSRSSIELKFSTILRTCTRLVLCLSMHITVSIDLAPLRTDFTDTRTALRLFLCSSFFSSFQLALFPSV